MRTLSSLWSELYFLTLITLMLIPWPGFNSWSLVLLSISLLFVFQIRFRNPLLGGLLFFGLSFLLLLADTQVINMLIYKWNGRQTALIGLAALVFNCITIAALRKMVFRYRIFNLPSEQIK